MNLNNIFIEPQVTIQSLDTGNYDAQSTILVNVTGLVCENICENRVLTTLNKIDSINNVKHKKGSGDFFIQISGSTINYEQIKSSILSQVIAMPVRKVLGQLWTLFVID
jgi:hypothetical protein